MKKWISYIFFTLTLPCIGIVIVGMSFASLFLSHQTPSIYQALILIALFLLLLVLPYLVVKYFNIAWWYPSILFTTPGVIWFLNEILTPNAHPYILLLPISIIIVFSLLSGRVGLNNGKSKIA